MSVLWTVGSYWLRWFLFSDEIISIPIQKLQTYFMSTYTQLWGLHYLMQFQHLFGLNILKYINEQMMNIIKTLNLSWHATTLNWVFNILIENSAGNIVQGRSGTRRFFKKVYKYKKNITPKTTFKHPLWHTTWYRIRLPNTLHAGRLNLAERVVKETCVFCGCQRSLSWGNFRILTSQNRF